jgi:hypothetical protein
MRLNFNAQKSQGSRGTLHRCSGVERGELSDLLREPAQLLRFDAISALAIDDSSAARRIVREHRRSESHPTLLELIDKVPAPK